MQGHLVNLLLHWKAGIYLHSQIYPRAPTLISSSRNFPGGNHDLRGPPIGLRDHHSILTGSADRSAPPQTSKHSSAKPASPIGINTDLQLKQSSQADPTTYQHPHGALPTLPDFCKVHWSLYCCTERHEITGKARSTQRH